MGTNKRILHEGRFLRLAELTGLTPSGIPFAWEIVERVNARGMVVVVPVRETDSEKIFIFVRHWRAPLDAWVIEFPAGLNDRNESLEIVARRELKEETGYEAEKLIHLGTFPASSGISSEKLACYLATSLMKTGEPKLEPLEELEVVEIPLVEVRERLDEARARGDYVDLKVYALVELAKEFFHA
ncbi:MAG: NUDIX hydrolase [Thermodesulfovibrionales bacterium]|nr:NUDIX hydrolase [Thermodesulfovibrionales bacterium]